MATPPPPQRRRPLFRKGFFLEHLDKKKEERHYHSVVDDLESEAYRLLVNGADDDQSGKLNQILNSLFEELSSRVFKLSIIDDKFKHPLKVLVNLVKYPNGARALVNHPKWLPKGGLNGLQLVKRSLLGPFLHLSALPDRRFKAQSLDLCWLLPSNLITGESNAGSYFGKTVRSHTNELRGRLEEVLISLLKNYDTRENVFEYLAEIIKQNSSMANIQVDPTCASSGMFVNLSALMLRLCKTLLDKDLKKRGEIDATYVFYNTRLDLSKLTSLHASSEEVAVWIDEDKHGNTNGSNLMSESDGATSSGNNRGKTKPMTTSSAKTKYTFACESFFMTARVLHLGLMKALSDMENVHQELATCKNTLSLLETMRGQGSHPQLLQDIVALERKFELYWRKYFCYLSQIMKDKAFLQQALSFYRLMVVWLVDLVGGFKLPLPSNCPMEFACIPEHFVEDVLELITVVLTSSRSLGQILPVMDEFMNFIIMFMTSPNYIRNSNLREKMVGLLMWCIRNRSCSASTMTIFEDNQLCLKYLVRNLLELYISNDFNGSTQLQLRRNIIEILEHLWKIPSHCNAWKQIAEDMGFYLVFLNFVINEIMLVFSKILHRIRALEEMEAEMSNSVEWERKSFQERHERALNMHNERENIGDNMAYVRANVGMLAFTSQQITVPFLLPQMVDIVVTMLNYMLLHVVGLQGKSLKQPMRHGYRLDILLNKIVSIYVHLARGDRENIFPAAISKNTRSYNHQLFTDAAKVVLHEDSSLIQEFVELGSRTIFAASKAMDTEAALGEIPQDFLDPIELTIMEDPVTLPSSKTVDRAVILRHLLNYNTDPFSGLPLTQDMLIPNVKLKAKIDNFMRSMLK